MLNKQIISCIVMLSTLLVALAWLYWPGINGPFLLDDYSNLNGLARIQELGWWKGTLQYLATNNSGPLGRPVSLLSFVLDGQVWPTDPESFKRTNIFLHLCNVLLVFTLAVKVAQHLLNTDRQSAVYMAGFVAALLWAIHPIQVSTVLYVVQRMTILSTLFGLASVLCLIKGRELATATPARSLVYLCGFKLLVVLSFFSKENGALVFPLAWMLESLLFGERNRETPGWYLQWRRIFLIAPTFLLVGYLIMQWPSAVASHEIRDFDIWHRLLTQPRVLALYLYNIFVPSSVAATIYFDSFPISSGPMSPPGTAVAIAGLMSAIIVAITMARRWRLLVLAVGWFLIAHSLEASFIPLELVFEHRNYLPTVGIAIVMGIMVFRAFLVCKELWQRVTVLAVLAFMLVMTIPWTAQAVANWSDESRLIYTWAFYDETSIRAQSDFAQLVAVQGQPTQAIQILESLVDHHPSEFSIRLRLASFYCEYKGGVPSSVWQDFDRQNHDLFSAGVLSAAQRYLRTASADYCPELDVDNVIDVFEILLGVDRGRLRSQAQANLHYMLGNYLIQKERFGLGFEQLDKASLLQPTIDVPLRQAVLMKNLGNLDRAEEYLEIARERNRTRKSNYPSREDELDTFSKSLRTVQLGQGGK